MLAQLRFKRVLFFLFFNWYERCGSGFEKKTRKRISSSYQVYVDTLCGELLTDILKSSDYCAFGHMNSWIKHS